MPATASLGAMFGFGRAQSSQNQIVYTNLQIWVDAGNNASYPGSGITWSNLFPANSGSFWYTLSNGPTVSTIVYNGTSNATLVFDGTNDYATPNTSLLTLAQANNWNETREYWVYWPGTPGCLTMESGTVSPDVSWFDAQMSMSNTGLYYSVWQGVAMVSYQVFSNLSAGQWNHLVWQHSKSSNLMMAYVNGVQTYSNASVARTTPDSMGGVGFFPILCSGSGTNFGNGSASNYAGSVGIFRWYNQILTSSMVVQNFNSERTRFGVGLPITNIRVLIIGDSSASTLSTGLATARTAMGLTAQTLTITTQLIGAAYTGANITTSNFDVVLLYTNGGLTYNASMGTNLNTYLTSGGHGVFGGFLWGNVGAVTNFNYSNNPYAYNGTYTSITTSTYSNTVTSPITTSAFLTGNTGVASASTPSPITVQANATSISQYSNGTSFIATQTSGSSRRVAINQYAIYNTTELNRLFCRAIYWTVGAI